MDYTILVIDDDEPVHLMAKNKLGKEFNIINAKDAQSAIDILSNMPVNLILTDIHMPGISGLELLESLRTDEQKNKIPVLVMTNLPTLEKEKKALNLGAADFIKKQQFNNDIKKVIELISMKLVTDVQIEGIGDELDKSKEELVMKLMEKAISGSYTDTAETFCLEFKETLKSPFTGLWLINNESVSPQCLLNDLSADPIKTTLDTETGFKKILSSKESYFSNHVYNEDLGMYNTFSKDNNLTAEIAIPLYKLSERDLLINNMNIDKQADIFGILVIKRSKLFTTTEFNLASRLGVQAGTILWRLFKNKSE